MSNVSLKTARLKRLSLSKAASRDTYLRRVYGITLQQYEEILKRQGGGCAICGKVNDGKRSLAVEHDHHSKFVRGVCCSYCNHRLIGRHRDPELLRKIADYISQHTEFKVPDKKKKRKKRVKK